MSFQRKMDAISSKGLAWIGFGENNESWSPGIFEILGLPPDAFRPSLDLFVSFIHPGDHHVREALAGLAAGKGRGETFFRIVRRDGTVRLVSLARPEHTPSGTPDWVCLFDYSTYFDPPGGRATASGHFAFADQLPSGLWGFYEPGGPLTLSPMAARVLGVATGERITLQQVLRNVDARDRDRAAQAFAGRNAGTERLSLSFARFDDGARRQIEVTLVGDAGRHGPGLGLWGTVADTTDQLARDNELGTLRGLVDTLMRDTADGILLLDRDARILRANAPARALLGLGDRDGTVLWDEAPDLVGDRLWRTLQGLSEPDARVEEEYYLPARGVWVAYTAAALGDRTLLIIRSRDEVHGLKAVVGDLAERCASGLSAGQAVLWEFDIETEKFWISDFKGGTPGARSLTLADLRQRLSEEDGVLVADTLRTARVDRLPFEILVSLDGSAGAMRRLRVRGRYDDALPGRRSRLAGIAVDGDEPPLSVAGSVRAGRRGEAEPAGVSGVQVRAARGALRWSVRELAELSNVSVATINRFEAGSKTVMARDTSVSALQRILVQHGIEFFHRPDERPAIAITRDAAAAAD